MNTQKTNTYLRLIAIGIVAFSFFGTSCTSLQQATTVATDDLYYTPNNKVVSSEKLVAAEKVQNGLAPEEEYQEYQNYQDDRYLRLKVANRNRWSGIDDWGYWNDPRYNSAFYPSYFGWNSWYSGYYGSSWYSPFGPSYSMGWGGYNPYMSWGYGGMGWGFDDFGFGYGGFGYGGFGYGMGYGGFGGFGYGGFGYGGWNPYYSSFYNPYGGIHYNNGVGGGYIGGGGFTNNGRPYQSPRVGQASPSAINAYRNGRGYNNENNSVNTTTGNTRYTSNPTLNSNFGNLMKRVVTSNTNTNYANSYDRPARYFSNNNYNGGNQNQTNSSNNNNNRASFQSSNNNNSGNSNAGGRSAGFNSAGSSSSSPRAARIP